MANDNFDIHEEQHFSPVEKDYDSSKKTMLLTVVMMLVMLAGLVGFAVWFKYLR